MVSFLSRLKPKKIEHLNLDENFHLQEKSSPGYTNPIHGLELKGKNARKVLEEFSAEQNPSMFLHIPKESYEEFREYLLQQVKKDSLVVLNISTDSSCEEFLRSFSPIRLSFRFKHYLFFFETDALGKHDADKHMFSLAMPEVVYQERRSGQRYRLLPDHKVLLNDMPVADISQKGLSFHSAHNFGKQNTIDNPALVLPPVYCETDDTSVCYFEGQTITIPQVTIANSIQEKGGYRYGGYFSIEWPDPAIKSLNDFLLALRKKSREEANQNL